MMASETNKEEDLKVFHNNNDTNHCVPDKAIEWILLNSCSSNVDLATISNISKQWRRVACSCIQQLLHTSSTHFTLGKNINNNHNNHNSSISSFSDAYKYTTLLTVKEQPRFSLLATLLLPDMAMEILRRTHKDRHLQELNSSSKILNDSVLDFIATNENPPKNVVRLSQPSSFCLAWFAPSGIQIKSIKLKESDSTDSDDDSSSSSSSSSSEEKMTLDIMDDVSTNNNDNDNKQVMDEQNRDQVKDNTRNNFSSQKIPSTKRRLDDKKHSNSFLKTCSNEWRGYRDAIDVLIPFGYCTSFVREVIQISAQVSSQISNKELTPVENSSNGKQTIEKRKKIDSCHYNSTFAVRGASLARPDGYCICWDNDSFGKFNNTAAAAASSSSSNVDLDKRNYPDNDQSSFLNSKNKRYRNNEKRRLRKIRKQKMKLLLPRMVMSNRVKIPYFKNGESPPKGRRQRCLQFLNADGMYAVRMRTAPFDCGPIQTPITIICIGIATEDGCFVSGLEKRLELGHMYPQNMRDELIDMSPVCIVSNAAEDPDDGNGFISESVKPGWLDNTFDKFYTCQDSESSNCELDEAYNLPFDCSCTFGNNHSSSSDMGNHIMNDDNVQEENITRGQLGPGDWHCYTAVFDDYNSLIRIDGIEEPRITKHDETDRSRKKVTPQRGAFLDGLTIGSDHSFNMSLCFGEGSDDEGEGSIAELVVFKGILNPSDLERVEQYLMNKHGIPFNTSISHMETNGIQSCETNQHCTDSKFDNEIEKVNSFNRWKEDDWKRQAHALMTQPPFYELGDYRVPLRLLSKHRSVAWDRISNVTGKSIKVSRIGSKNSNGSSDW